MKEDPGLWRHSRLLPRIWAKESPGTEHSWVDMRILSIELSLCLLIFAEKRERRDISRRSWYFGQDVYWTLPRQMRHKSPRAKHDTPPRMFLRHGTARWCLQRREREEICLKEIKTVQRTVCPEFCNVGIRSRCWYLSYSERQQTCNSCHTIWGQRDPGAKHAVFWVDCFETWPFRQGFERSEREKT